MICTLSKHLAVNTGVSTLQAARLPKARPSVWNQRSCCNCHLLASDANPKHILDSEP